LEEADQRSALAQRELADSLGKLGAGQLSEGDSKGALASFQEALGIRRQLTAADPRSAAAQRELAVSLDEQGGAQLAQGDNKAALDSFREALGIFRLLAENDPRSAQAQRDLILSYFKLGNLAETQADFRQAADWFAKGREVARGFVKPEVLGFFDTDLGRRVAFCRTAELALDDLAVIDKQPASDHVPLWPLLAALNKAFVQRKDLDKAVQTAGRLGRDAWTASMMYEAACAHSRCVPLADRTAVKEKLAARAVDLLRQAVSRGFKDIGILRAHPDLDPLRQRDDFQKLLAELEQTQPPVKP
jgi:tetratricopeptide (TPR) repeat protein